MIPGQQLEKAFQTSSGKLKGHKAKSRKRKIKKQKEETHFGQSIDPATEGSAEAWPEKKHQLGAAIEWCLQERLQDSGDRGRSPGEDRKPES